MSTRLRTTKITVDDCQAFGRVLVSLLAVLAGCAMPMSPEFEDADEIGAQRAELNARTDYEPESTNECSPYMMLLHERATSIARAVVASPAFRTCLENTMQDRYLPCSGSRVPDTFGPARPLTPTSSTIADANARFDLAMTMLSQFNNPLALHCSMVGVPLGHAGVSATLGTYGHTGVSEMNTGINYHEQNDDWDDDYGLIGTCPFGPGCALDPDPTAQLEPWASHVRDLPHEYSHTHGYTHPEFACEQVLATRTGVGASYPTSFTGTRRFSVQIDGGVAVSVTLTGGMSLAQVVSSVNAALGCTSCALNSGGQLRIVSTDFTTPLVLANIDSGALEAVGLTSGSTLSVCSSTDCDWIDACGGSGTPTYADWNQRNYCIWYHTEGNDDSDDGYYSRPTPSSPGTEPSLPYILNECTRSVMKQSQLACSRVLDNPSCGNGELMLLESWSGRSQDPQPAGNCICVPDPQRLLTLWSNSTGYWTAWGGGGSDIVTNTSTRLGPWQTFWMIDTNDDYLGVDHVGWSYGDAVQLKTYAGNFVAQDFDANGAYYHTMFFESLTATGRVQSGDTVYIRSNAGAPWYAYDTGAQVSYTTGGIGQGTPFRADTFRREHMVYLRSPHSISPGSCSTSDEWCRYVAYRQSSANFYADMPHGWLADQEPDVQTNAIKRLASFWLIDWNGGAIQNGDVVSFEHVWADTWHYLSTNVATTTTPLRRIHSVAAQERFTIIKVSGSPGNAIGDRDVIALRSSNGNYVTVFPTAGDVNNAGTWLGPWQHLTLRMVQYVDRDRPTWDGEYCPPGGGGPSVCP